MGAMPGAFLLIGSLALVLAQSPGKELDAGYDSITEKDLLVHVTELAAPQLEGRDSPSEGLFRAGEYLIGRMKAAGVAPCGQHDTYRMTYTLKNPAPLENCLLAMTPEGGEERVFVLEEDYVPLPSCPGDGEGPLSFFGFGITESEEKRYDDLKGKNCKGEIVMVLEGEPRSKKLFEGPVVTRAADGYAKVKALEERGAHGVLIVRRPPAEQLKGLEGRLVAPSPIGFRHTWAHWNHKGDQPAHSINAKIPVLEITEATASLLLGEDVAELASKIESSGKPVRREVKGVRVTLRSAIGEKPLPIDNIVGVVRGSDPALAEEYVVLGAHYDHVGVDAWGRIGPGADDNGSGSAGLMEIAEAMALAKPKRSVLFAWFSAEEDGLFGSEEFCERPPVPMASVVAMLNVDMIGRCAEDEVYVVGTNVNPALEDVLKEAKKLKPVQLKKIFTDKAQDLWERSDQYNFHKKGVPALFFTEGAIDAENPDYHNYGDTVDKLSLTKMAKITRFLFNTAWLIADAEKRPPPPR